MQNAVAAGVALAVGGDLISSLGEVDTLQAIPSEGAWVSSAALDAGFAPPSSLTSISGFDGLRMVWDRVLTTEEIQEIMQNPYAMFEDPGRVVLNGRTSGCENRKVTGSIPVAASKI